MITLPYWTKSAWGVLPRAGHLIGHLQVGYPVQATPELGSEELSVGAQDQTILRRIPTVGLGREESGIWQNIMKIFPKVLELGLWIGKHRRHKTMLGGFGGIPPPSGNL